MQDDVARDNWEKFSKEAEMRGYVEKRDFECPLCDGTLFVNKFDHYIECDGMQHHKFSHTGSRVNNT